MSNSTHFDSKHFNPQAFKYVVDRVPNLKLNQLRKSKALSSNNDIRNVFSSQNGVAYAKIAMRGLLDGDPLNYDGDTDISASSSKSFEQGIVVVGRAKAWTEKDFAFDVTGGVDFIDNIASQVSEYWVSHEQDTLLSILKGIFSMSGSSVNQEFIDLHTYDVTSADDGCVSTTTLNSAMQQACGDNKKKFTLVLLHSTVATNLENLNLIKNLTYTDKDGLTRDIELYTWNGRLVLVDDSATAEDVGSYTQYTSYVLGDGAFSYEDIGAKVPFEMSRDAASSGGTDILYSRIRKVFSPFGISYEKINQVSNSPTSAELEDGDNWSLVHTGETDISARSYISHKAIPIARIISKG